MRGSTLLGMSLITLGIAIAPTAARANLIVNGGFEVPALNFGSPAPTTPLNISVGSGVLSGWGVIGNTRQTVLLIRDGTSETPNGITNFNAKEGLNALDLTGSGNVGTEVGIEQTVGTVAGQEYTLSFYVGRATPSGGPSNYYTRQATIDLSIDGGARVGYTNTGMSNLGGVDWLEYSYTFTAATNSTLIRFYNGTPLEATGIFDPDTNYAGLDDVRLNPTTAVPEPASMAMIAVGALALAGARFARRRSA